jgi:hypothetical protein
VLLDSLVPAVHGTQTLAPVLETDPGSQSMQLDCAELG